MKRWKGIILMGVLTMLSGCSGAKLDHYKGSSPQLDLKEYFSGPIKAWGVVQDFKGRVTRRFDIDMVGEWDGDEGTLTEHFKYYDGKEERRIWKIKKVANNKYVGNADDILGDANGEQNGHAMRWAYQMDLDVEGKTYRLTFDDWMFLMNDGVLINRSYLKKFGITVAELTIFMQKQED